MALTEQEVRQIKSQILKQIESFPPEQRQAARQQIESMSPKQLEQFLIQNSLIKEKRKAGQESSEPSGCVFCSIIERKTQSHQIDENKSAIGILDINPVSKGQALIVPRKHETIEKLPSSVLSLAKKIAKKLKNKLKPKPQEIKIETSSVQGHGIISVIPIYKDAKLERKSADSRELQELREGLQTKKRTLRKTKSKRISELPKAPRRIP